MSANELIVFAAAHGLSVGRYRPGVYRYGYTDQDGVHEFAFAGTWREFVEFIRAFVGEAA